MHESGGKELRVRGSAAGYGGGYILAGAESCRKAAVMVRPVILGGGGVVQVKGFRVEDNVGGSEDGLVMIAVEGVVCVSGIGHVAAAAAGIGSHHVLSHPRFLSIGGILTQIVYGLAIFTDAKSKVAWLLLWSLLWLLLLMSLLLACTVLFVVSF
jgi:hypothetical protein